VTEEKEKESLDQERAPFLTHLGELRRRIVRSLIGVLVGFLICWIFKEQLFQILAAPVLKVLADQKIQVIQSTQELGSFLQGLIQSGLQAKLQIVQPAEGLFAHVAEVIRIISTEVVKTTQSLGPMLKGLAQLGGSDKLQVIHPAEAFFAFLKVSLLGGVALAVPFIFYQIWRFISPGLYSRERRMVWPFIGWGTFCFIAGVCFCYFLVLPFGLKFLANFGSQFMDYKPAVSPYLSFVVRLTFAFGLVFELPVVLFFLGRVGIVNSQQLSRFRKFFLVLAFLMAAILTPPDVFTQILMAGPLLVLYEVSIQLVKVAERRKAAAQKEAEAEFQ
jgi:sec-independent protein translocase protein TatC